MNQYLQAITLVKIRTIAILTSLGLATALLLTVIFSQTSHALILDKLLPQTNQALTGVVNQVLSPSQLPTPPRSPAANPQPAPQSSSSATQSSPASGTAFLAPVAPQSQPAAPAQRSYEPLQLVATSLQPIEFLPASYSDGRRNNTSIMHAAVASPRSSLLLESTEQGWQFLGIMWYGWLVAAAGLVASVIFWKRKGEQLSYQLLSWRNITYAD